MTLSIQPLTAEQIMHILAWEYDGPYAMYNMAAENPEEAVRFFGDPGNSYWAIVDESGALLGYCNFGADAQVPGGDYSTAALDVGMGVRPDLTGQGKGARYAAAVFEFARQQFPQPLQRVTIFAFNQRARRLCQNFGFQISDRFERATDGRPIVIMNRVITISDRTPAG